MHSVRVGGCGLPRVRSPGEITRPQETSPVKHQRYFPHMGRPSYIPSSEGMCQYQYIHWHYCYYVALINRIHKTSIKNI